MFLVAFVVFYVCEAEEKEFRRLAGRSVPNILWENCTPIG